MKLRGLRLLVTLIIVFTNICCASSICNETQEATLFTTFEVECSLLNHNWTSVVYRSESNDLIRYQKDKCGNPTGQIIGPRDKDGTLHITNTGVLVFNNITMNDSANYQLVYIDCAGGTYDQYTDNFNISVHNIEEPTNAPSESSTTSSQPNTSVRSANSQCPNGCECPGRSDQDFTTISCFGLDDLPNLPKEVSDLTIADSPRISEIPPGYFNLPSLTDLNLSNNDLETISKESFEYVGSLQNIDLSMNPIVCNKKIDWLQIWRESYPRNKVIGNCTNGNTISNYLDGKPGAALTIKLGDDDLTFDRTCESLYIAATLDSAAPSAMTYRFTYLPDEGSEGDLEIDDEVTLPAGARSMVINVRVNDGGSAGDPQRSYLLVLVPKSITAVGTEMKIILDDDVSTCSTVQTTVSPTVQTTVSPSTMPTTDKPPVPLPVVVIVILILVLIGVIVGVIVYCMFYKKEKVAESANPAVAYSPVGEKVYNPTTEEKEDV